MPLATNALTPKEKLAKLRTLMETHGVDGYIVYTADAHGSEYPPEHDCRRAFLTEFTGSAGTALITNDAAYLWTDARYFIQAEEQLDTEAWKLMKAGLPGTPTTTEFIKNSSITSLGIDPECISIASYKKFEEELKDKMKIVSITPNLVDTLWGTDQPPYAVNPIFPHSKSYTGEDAAAKIGRIRAKMETSKASFLVVSALDEIAWTLNLRGSDLVITPVFRSYLIIGETFVNLYVEESQLTENAKIELKALGAQICPYNSVFGDLKKFAAELAEPSKIWMDSTVNLAVYNTVSDDKLVHLDATPICLMKSIKNNAEIEGMRQAHIKDGAAETKFLHWLSKCKADKTLFEMTECDLSDKIDYFRSQQVGYFCLSFPTISGIGANGAIIHYRAEKGKCSMITPSMYLVDSGAQYIDGTTDITRTVHFGEATKFEKEAWTRVLKGHISLASATFPQGTKGPHLDAFARQHLWKVGLEYRHGTGHGVGAFLNVHEGPCGISGNLLYSAASTNLEPGMILSNEPGYYQTNDFGVRLENLVCVVEANTPNHYDGMKFYAFETITLAPFAKEMIDFSIMNKEDIEWLNEYHDTVFKKVSQYLKEEEKRENVNNEEVIEWLKDATSPIEV